MGVKGKRVLITGAAGGFGVATAKALLAEGAHVVGVDLRPGLADLDYPIVNADLRDAGQIEAGVAEAIARLGGLDVLINNAGINGLEDPGTAPGAGSIEKLEVNLLGTWRVTAAALPALLAARGRVINVASLGAFVIVPYLPAYSASKRAVAAYSDVLRSWYGSRIGVTTVYPSYMRTGIHDAEMDQGLWVDRLYATRLGGFTLFTWEERLDVAARAMVRACSGRAVRDRALTFRGWVVLMTARHMPALAEWMFKTRIDQLVRGGMRLRLNGRVVSVGDANTAVSTNDGHSRT